MDPRISISLSKQLSCAYSAIKELLVKWSSPARIKEKTKKNAQSAETYILTNNPRQNAAQMDPNGF